MLDHEHEVGDGGRVDRAAGAGPHDRGDLRDDARGQGIAQEDVGVAGEGDDALLDARAPESLSPMMGTPVFMARSMILQIFRAYASESEPPNTVKSWANTNTGRP